VQTMALRGIVRRFSSRYSLYKNINSGHAISFSTNTTELPPHNKVKVPDFGSKGTILDWHKIIGEEVKEGGILVDVSFDEFDVEIVSEVNGYLASITATKESGELDPGSELGVIVSDIDYIPFFSPHFSLPSTSSSSPTPDKLEDNELEERNQNNNIDKSDDRNDDSDSDTDSDHDDDNDNGKENMMNKKIKPPTVSSKKEEKEEPTTISGMQMLLAIKQMIKTLELDSHPLPDEHIRALKELAVSEDIHLKNCFFAASDLSIEKKPHDNNNDDGSDDDEVSLGALDTIEFLELSKPLIEKHIQEKE